ncbi:MAG: hypothetical protein HS109_08175 [Burkholderiales bacterium]|nr:hypothetical protein [Burkholderiales bacterium]
MKAHTGAFVLTIALASCATPAPDAARTADALWIQPYAIHEVCFKLAEGDRVDWRFESRQPVDFNFHYHEGAAVVSPLVKTASFGDSGIFPVRVPQDYCAMWEAGPLGALISYRVVPVRAAR